MMSPYDTRPRASNSMQRTRVENDDPVKLIEQLQNYIVRLQNTAKDVPRRRPSRRSYEKLSFDDQLSRDLPPTIRAIVEDNRMLRSSIKKWKGRCRSAEREVQKERLRTEQCRLEFASYQKCFTEEDLLAIENHKELEERTQILQTSVEEKEHALAVLEKKQRVDAKMHQVTLLQRSKETDALKKQIKELEEEIRRLSLKYRTEIVGSKRITARYEEQKRRAMRWREQLNSLLEKEESKLMLGDVTVVDPDTNTAAVTTRATLEQTTEERVILMLCVVEDTETRGSLTESNNSSTSMETPFDSLNVSRSMGEECFCEKREMRGGPDLPSAAVLSSEAENGHGEEDLHKHPVEECAESVPEMPNAEREAAALKIQCALRGMFARKEFERRRVSAMQYGPKNVASSTKTVTAAASQRRLAEVPKTTKGKHLSQTPHSTQPNSRNRKPTLA